MFMILIVLHNRNTVWPWLMALSLPASGTMTPATGIIALSATERNVSQTKALFLCFFRKHSQQFEAGSQIFLFWSASSIQPPPPTKSPCPADYISWYQNCYKLIEKPATWDAAQATCEEQGGNLASIDMSYDQAFVAGVVLQGKADAWIGLKRQVLQ